MRSVLLLQRREPSFRRGADRRTKTPDNNENNSQSSSSMVAIGSQAVEKKKEELLTMSHNNESTQFTLSRPQKDPTEFEFDPLTVFEGNEDNFVVTIVED